MVTGRLAIALSQTGDAVRAARACERAYEIRLGLDDPLGAATSLLNLAAVHLNAGQPAEAIRHLRRAQRLGRTATDSAFLMVLVHSNLGEAMHLSGHLDRAMRHYRTALDLARAGAGGRDVAHLLVSLAGVLRDAGGLAPAAEQCERGLALASEAGDAVLAAEAHDRMGRILLDRGSPTEAVEHLRSALRVYEATGHRKSDEMRRLLGRRLAS